MDGSFGSTEFLQLMVKHGLHVVLEHSIPDGKLKRDLATLKTPDGRDARITLGAFTVTPVELPIRILDDFLRARFVQETDQSDDGAKVTYQLTDDGIDRGQVVA